MLNFLNNAISPAVEVFFMSMLPITEQRLSIPYGITVLGMDPLWAFFWGTSGNIVISLVLIRFLDSVTSLLRKHFKFMDRFFHRLFERTRTKHSKRMSELGHLALFTFVAVPLPGSGAWTGSLVAYVFGIHRQTAYLLVSLGLVATGLIMTFGTKGILLLSTWWN